MSSWDNAYRTTPPWDIGRPQPAFVDLAMNRELESKRVLDLGCGTGENAIFLAENGYSVIGIDAARTAVEAAKSKASARGVRVDFRVGNALSLELDRATFDNVIDSGLFHTFSDSDRQVFAAQVGRVLRGGGKYFMLCFSEKEPIDWGGPRRVTKEEIQETFSPLFTINYVRDALFATRTHEKGGKAYLTSATRRSDGSS